MPDFTSRQVKLLAACPDLDTLLICSPGSCFGLNGTAQGHMTFLCGWNSYDSPSVLLLQRGRRPWLLVAHHRMHMMALEMCEGSDLDIEWIDQTEFGRRVSEKIRVNGKVPARIGLLGWEDMLAKPWKTIEEGLGSPEFVDVTAQIAELRAVKDDEQIAIHRRVATVCDEMFAMFAGMDVVGRYTYDVKAELECHARRRGCDFVQHWMSTGQGPDYPRYYHHENRQIIRPDDTILYGMMMTIDGIWSHAVRCYYVGEPEPWRKDAQTALIDFQSRMLGKMRPGVELSALVKTSLQEITTLVPQFGDPKSQVLRLGHGMGCSYAEPGLSQAFPRSFYNAEDEASRIRPVVLKAGMLFQIHPMVVFPGGAAGLGDIALIGEGGAERLTKFPRELCLLRA